ncbi:MAG TPA: TadE/TadG family type IV pilus assembly protein [Novosphingobium sp.]|nr:TadE/TadG family type IV pilus assembly protein [Novosphingobium sp.]
MRKLLPLLHRLGERRGSAVVEFAILAPTFIAMLMGIFWVGIQMQQYNALRSIAADVNRYAVVEYQKENKLDEGQIEDVARAIAVKVPYQLTGESFDAEVTLGTSTVSGAKKFILNMGYNPPNFLDYLGINATDMNFSQDIYVPA